MNGSLKYLLLMLALVGTGYWLIAARGTDTDGNGPAAASLAPATRPPAIGSADAGASAGANAGVDAAIDTAIDTGADTEAADDGAWRG